MNPRSLARPAGLALALAALAAPPAMASAQAQTAQATPQHEFKVIGSRVYLDTHARGKGTLMVRVKARYRFRPALAHERWFGVTTITVKGPGGSTTVRDVDRLLHPVLGQMIDHRVVLGAKQASRILGPRGAKATVHLAIRGHVQMTRPAGENTVQPNPTTTPPNPTATQPSPAVGTFADVLGTPAHPPAPQSYGGVFFIHWTLSPPYRPYASALYTETADGAAVFEPSYDANGNPQSGFLVANDPPDDAFGSFNMVASMADYGCSQPGTVLGYLAMPVNGVFPPPGAQVQWGSCFTAGAVLIPRDRFYQG